MTIVSPSNAQLRIANLTADRKGSNGVETDVCCGEMSKIHPATRVHFRKETGQRLTASAFVDEIDSFDDTTVFLLEGNVVVELDQNELRIFNPDGSATRVDRAELSKDKPYVLDIPERF